MNPAIPIKKYIHNVKSRVDYLNKTNPNIMIFITYGILYDIVLNTYKPFLAKFLQRLGGGEFFISLLNSLPGLVAALVLIPGAIFISRFKNKKRVTTLFFALSRTFLLGLFFIPFFPQQLWPLLCVILISTMNLPEALSQTSLQGLLGSVFDGRVRSYAIGLRSKAGYIMVVLVTLITGLVLSSASGGEKGNEHTIRIYQMFFIFAFLVGIAEIIVFNRFKVAQQENTAHKLELSVVKLIFKDKAFMKYFVTTLSFSFMWQMGWPLCTIYQIDTLNANEFWFAIFAVCSGATSFFTAGRWNRIISKKGNHYAIWLAMVTLAVNLFFYPLIPNVYVMTLGSMLGGFCVAGINMSLLNGLLFASPDDNRLVYISVYNTFSNVSLFLSPLAAYFLLRLLGINLTLFIASGLRFLCSMIFYVQYKAKIKDREASV